MKTNKIIAGFALATIIATGAAFAQDGNTQTGGTGMPPPPDRPRPGMFQQFFGNQEERKEFREERREDRKEFREEMKENMKEFKDGMKDLRDWKNSSTTATGTRPTPYKDFKKEMMEDRKDFRDERREDRKEMREEMGQPRPRPLNATATAAIAAKLGITADALTAQLASGTKLRDLIKDKISPEEMKSILPPRVATFTRPVEEKGFFNKLRSNLFGPRNEVVTAEQDEYGEVNETTKPEPRENQPFWRRFFNF